MKGYHRSFGRSGAFCSLRAGPHTTAQWRRLLPQARIDIIVPTYNGARTLAATLGALQGQVRSGDRVSVVLNGCTDQSAVVAERSLAELRASGAEANILVCADVGRSAALTTGDALADGHRLYIDQDARLSVGGLELIRDAFRGGAEFVCGEAIWRTPNRWVREAMHAWNQLPYVREAAVTAGMYGVSKSGRCRWREWPRDMPDDKWARLHFLPAERRRLPGVFYSVEAPTTFGGLVENRLRYRKMNAALKVSAPELLKGDVPRTAGLVGFTLDPRRAPGSLLLAAAEVVARTRR